MSLKFRVPNTEPFFTHRLLELGEYLTATVVEPFCLHHGVCWDRRFKDFFSPSKGSHPLEATGSIDFHLPAYFVGQMGELESRIRSQLEGLGIKLGALTYTNYPGRRMVETIHIPILENPTAVDAPPDVNMSKTAACLVLRGLLGYAQVDGRFELPVEDVLKRVSTITDEQIQKCSVAPLRDPEAQVVRRTPSAVTMKRVRRCLDELTRFVQWVANHNYRTVEVY